MIALICGIIYTAVSLVVFFSAYRTSRFWILLLSFEYFYILGLGVFPIAFVLGYADVPPALEQYGGIEVISSVSYFNIIFYSFGALVGYFSFPSLRIKGATYIVRKSMALNLDPLRAFWIFIGLAFISTAAFIILLGPEKVFVGASLYRSGVVDEFQGFESYLFLTRFLYFAVFAVAFLPHIFSKKKSSYFELAAISIIGLVGYLVLSARYMLAQCLVLPFCYYFVYSGRIGVGKIVSLLLLVLLPFLTILYGKEFPSVLANYLFGTGDFEFVNSNSSNGFFNGFSHLIYSVDAGVRSFTSQGPFVSLDAILSLLGIFPSGIFSFFGLDALSYQHLDADRRFSCVNTLIVDPGYRTCYLPPYFTGVSAYVMPLVGGFIFGFLRFFIYSVISLSWRRLVGNEHVLPGVIIFVICAEQIMLFIPNSTSFVVFLLVFIWLSRRFGFLSPRE